jgi:ribosomal protein L6P/L9E
VRSAPNPNSIVIFGADKQAVGRIFSVIRKRRGALQGRGITVGEVAEEAGKSFGTGRYALQP